MGKILRQLYNYREIKIIEARAMPDHIHIFLKILPKLPESGLRKRGYDSKLFIDEGICEAY